MRRLVLGVFLYVTGAMALWSCSVLFDTSTLGPGTTLNGGDGGSEESGSGIPCGTGRCPASDAICCWKDGGFHCAAGRSACTGVPIECSAPGDCASTATCCISVEMGSVASILCSQGCQSRRGEE